VPVVVLTGILAVLASSIINARRPAWEGGARNQSPYHQAAPTPGTERFTPPDWSIDEPIYEVDVRHYTASGTLREFSEHLPQLRSLGVGIIWLMPIFPRGQERADGSPYAVRHHLAVDPALGSIQDFDDMVGKAHSLGMHVILDFVANHTSWDHPWIKAHPDWYQRNAAGEIRSPTADWTDVAQLDYTNRALRSEMIRALRWWVEQAKVDGFRFDAAWNVPPDFFAQARMELERTKPVFFLAEADDPAYHPMNDMTYAWDLPDLYADIAAGRKPASDIDTYLAWERTTFPKNAIRMRYTTNHDISHEESMQARYRGGVDAFAVVSNNLPGKPLVYNGQETGLDHRLDEHTRITTQPDFANNAHRRFYSTLLHLYRDSQALSRGQYTKLRASNSAAVLAFARRHGTATVLTIVNLSATPQTVSLDVGGFEGGYTDAFTGGRIRLKSTLKRHLRPWGYQVLQRTG
jgi:cyclomaltodextrinase / maltogenic alpha-amylase / neopullulanase